MWYHDFGDTLLTSEERSALAETGQAPMVTWEPHKQSLSQIAAGSYDSYLRDSAGIAKEWGGELMVRFAHEMNGTWYPWSRSSSYVAAWRHIVSVFREAGADNVRWVWAPNVDGDGSKPFAQYFPGDEWVDYVGLDGYNWGGAQWASLESVFSASYDKITQLSSKPVMITETASSEAGGDKAAWIRTGFIKTIPQRFPRVVGVVWFNKVQEDNWPVTSSQEALDAYRDVVSCSTYGGAEPCEAGETEAISSTEEAPVSIRAIRVTRRVAPALQPSPAASQPASEERKAARQRARRRRARLRGTMSYRLSRRAKKVRIKIQRRRGRGFVKRAVVVRRAHSGRNRVALSRLLHNRKLGKGKYRVTVVASSGRGSRSRPRRAHFRVTS